VKLTPRPELKDWGKALGSSVGATPELPVTRRVIKPAMSPALALDPIEQATLVLDAIELTIVR